MTIPDYYQGWVVAVEAASERDEVIVTAHRGGPGYGPNNFIVQFLATRGEVQVGDSVTWGAQVLRLDRQSA